MEKEDKIIRDLLLKMQTEKAPEGFTDSVMEAVEAAGAQKQTVQSDWLYWLVITGSLLLAGVVLFIVDPSLILQYAGLFTGFFKQLAGLAENMSGFGSDQLMTGTFVIMLVLLLADGMFWHRRQRIHLFLWI
jgi:hypothetical protein